MSELKPKKYSFNYGPWMTLPTAKSISEQVMIPFDQEAVNCQLFLHYLYQNLFGVNLPQLWSKEIYEDEELIFRSVKRDEHQYIGDIYMFQPFKQPDFDPKNIQLAFGTGNFEDTKPYLIHANKYDQGVGIWRLDDFIKPVGGESIPRYKLKSIKRLKDEMWIPHIKSFVRTHVDFESRVPPG